MKTELEWISVNDKLPEIPENKPKYNQSIKVIGMWGEHWAEFDFVRRIVYGKIVERFEWNGRINTFPITHWAIPKLIK